MQTPADFPRGERDSLPCPRKVSRGLVCLVSVPMTLGKEWVWEWLCPLGFPGDCFCPQGVSSEAGERRLKPQGGVGRGCCVASAYLSPSLSQAFCLSCPGFSSGACRACSFLWLQLLWLFKVA